MRMTLTLTLTRALNLMATSGADDRKKHIDSGAVYSTIEELYLLYIYIYIMTPTLTD